MKAYDKAGYYLENESHWWQDRPPINLDDVAPYYNRKVDEIIDNFLKDCKHYIEYGMLTDQEEQWLANEINKEVWEPFCAGDYHRFDTVFEDGEPDPMPEPIWND